MGLNDPKIEKLPSQEEWRERMEECERERKLEGQKGERGRISEKERGGNLITKMTIYHSLDDN